MLPDFVHPRDRALFVELQEKHQDIQSTLKELEKGKQFSDSVLNELQEEEESKKSALNSILGWLRRQTQEMFADILNVMNNAHETITSLAEVPDRSFIVTPATHRRLHELYRTARERLEIKSDYLLFCTMEYNRVAKTVGTDDDPMIVIDSACLHDFNDGQLLALLGRELGHIKLKHVKYLTALNLIDTLTGFSNAASAVKGLLYEWTLAAHFSADRAGAIVAGDILPVIYNNLMTSGLETLADCEDYEAYLQADMLNERNNFDRTTKMLMSNTLREFPMPFVIERTKELILWAQSEECEEKFPEIYNANRQPVSSRVENMIKTRTSSPPAPATLFKGEHLNLKHYRKFTAVFEWNSDAQDMGIDLAVFLTDENNRVSSDEDFVFYNNVRHESRAATLNDNGSIEINLLRVPEHIEQISLAVAIYDADNRGQNFGMIRDKALKIFVYDIERVTFPLESFTYETAIVLGEFYRSEGGWKFIAIGKGYRDGFNSLCNNFGVNIG
ncbi:MAG: TerD family protein [Selenomonadaceae bacterium]|nr:TerD family protein [Selenomonadaceae bacterium]